MNPLLLFAVALLILSLAHSRVMWRRAYWQAMSERDRESGRAEYEKGRADNANAALERVMAAYQELVKGELEVSDQWAKEMGLEGL